MQRRARTGYRVLMGTPEGAGDGERVIFSTAGDINGDGRQDVLMDFPNGDSQILFILP